MTANSFAWLIGHSKNVQQSFKLNNAEGFKYPCLVQKIKKKTHSASEVRIAFSYILKMFNNISLINQSIKNFRKALVSNHKNPYNVP